MILATVAGERTGAQPGMRGTCPSCEAAVIAKCGTVNVWHWAHEAGADCDPWAKPMSEWHLGWQNEVPPEQREVVIGNHRADIITARGHVVEVQHSFLSEADIAERETFYVRETGRRMFWIFDVASALEERHQDSCARLPWPCDDQAHLPRLDLRRRGARVEDHSGQEALLPPDGDMYRTFRWKHARKSVAAARQTVFLDLGRGWLLLVGRIYPEAPVGGYGWLWTRDQVVNAMNQGVEDA